MYRLDYTRLHTWFISFFSQLVPPVSAPVYFQSNNFFAALDDSGDEAPASKGNKKVAIKKEPETPKPVVEAPKKDAGYVMFEC